ncbi:hypothetical protein AB205_0033200 [Aquarana catesbeiana]|uniref:Uncharacterized protein n=1 Tax=Aquarana catesbeiana TaxID=8400 RepID=A0A2G9SAV9_AQUCT|nr:hypothetical protein AB205_0033200 [Aquarana catesbeiana]
MDGPLVSFSGGPGQTLCAVAAGVFFVGGQKTTEPPTPPRQLKPPLTPINPPLSADYQRHPPVVLNTHRTGICLCKQGRALSCQQGSNVFSFPANHGSEINYLS